MCAEVAACAAAHVEGQSWTSVGCVASSKYQPSPQSAGLDTRPSDVGAPLPGVKSTSTAAGSNVVPGSGNAQSSALPWIARNACKICFAPCAELETKKPSPPPADAIFWRVAVESPWMPMT